MMTTVKDSRGGAGEEDVFDPRPSGFEWMKEDSDRKVQSCGQLAIPGHRPKES